MPKDNPLADKFEQAAALSSYGLTESLVSAEEIVDMPLPEWLISGVMLEGSYGVLYAPPESGKSFIALSWAMAIASGNRWLGREVKQGPVVYAVGEGLRGFGPRVQAWADRYNEGEVPQDLKFVKRPIYLMQEADVDMMIQVIKQGLKTTPSLVVIDTLARAMAGGDENSAPDMSVAMEHVGRIQRELDTAVIVVHHTRKNDEVERGHSSLRGAADLMVLVSRAAHGDRIHVECTKQKDFVPFDSFNVKLTQHSDSAVITHETAGGAGGDDPFG